MEPVVKTVKGKVRGQVTGGTASFTGIPYAAPPFGVNRMRPPAPPEAWDGVRDALAYGPTVPKRLRLQRGQEPEDDRQQHRVHTASRPDRGARAGVARERLDPGPRFCGGADS